MFKIVALIAFMVMGVIIIRKPEPIKQETKIDTTHVAPIIINNWQPRGSVAAPVLPDVVLSGMDSAQLRAMLEEYLKQYKELFAEHNATNKYDTTFSDSTYKETISMDVRRNKLARFTRNMEVYNRTTTITKPNRFALLGGGFGYSDGIHTAAGFQLSAQTVRGDLYSVGYDMLNKGWYGSMQFKIRLRK